MRPSYLYNRNPYTSKTASSNWEVPQVPKVAMTQLQWNWESEYKTYGNDISKMPAISFRSQCDTPEIEALGSLIRYKGPFSVPFFVIIVEYDDPPAFVRSEANSLTLNA